MGNAESNPVRNMDKRTARREYRDDFAAAIERYRQRVARLGHNALEDCEMDDNSWDNGSIRVCVRRRPIFRDELKNFEFDVVTCINGKQIVVHDARMHTDMKRQFINHHEFSFDRVFNERSANDEVYAGTAAPLTAITVRGGYATCLMYGQTGSGKTYTMSSIYERAAQNIFSLIEGNPQYTVSVSFMEIAGDNCFDLLNAFQPTQLLTGRNGSVHPFPVVEPTVSTAEELIAFVNHGRNVRTTAATGVHDASSRSHAILRIYVQNKSANIGHSEMVQEGVLTLVDLAGSEHRIDSMYHSAERRKEGAAINSSLMALKECIRARAAGRDLNHYYRKSKLTMALKSSFANPEARTVVIVTVSPASKDTEHSLNSLRHACIMDGQDTSSGGETRFVTGGKTTAEQIGEIDISAMSKKAIANRRAGKDTADARTSNGNTFGSVLKHEEDKPMSEKEKMRMRHTQERKAMAALSPASKAILKAARSQLGQNRRQHNRLHVILAERLPSSPSRTEFAASSPRGEREVGKPHISSGLEPARGGDGGGADVCFQLVEKKPGGISRTPIGGDTTVSTTSPRPSPAEGMRENSLQEVEFMSEFNSRNMPRYPIQTDGDLRRAVIGEGVPGCQGKESSTSRKSVKKLRAMIFCDELAPEELKRRQFSALLRQNGYSKAEVEGIVEREIARAEQKQQTRELADGCERGDGVVRGGSRVHTQSAGSTRRAELSRGGSSAAITAPRETPTDPEPTVSRHEAAKLRRQKIEIEARQRKQYAMSKKAQQAVIPSPEKLNGEEDYTAAMTALENELNDSSLTSASRHGIMKRIATLKSVHIREKRWKEQEKREAEKYQRRMVQEAEAEKRRLKEESLQPSASAHFDQSFPASGQRGSTDLRGRPPQQQQYYLQEEHGTRQMSQALSPVGGGYPPGGEVNMANTAMIESYLSPRGDRSGGTTGSSTSTGYSPPHHSAAQQHRRYQHPPPPPAVRESRGRACRDYPDSGGQGSRGVLLNRTEGDGATHGHRGGMHGGGGRERDMERSDSLDRMLRAASPITGPTIPVRGQPRPQADDMHHHTGHDISRRHQQSAGYAAAPFANDMNWDHMPT